MVFVSKAVPELGLGLVRAEGMRSAKLECFGDVQQLGRVFKFSICI